MCSGTTASYKNYYIRTPTNIRITLANCGLTDDEMRQTIYNSLATIIPGLQLSDIGTITRSGCTKKRVGGESVTVSIQGANGVSSQSIAYQAQTTYTVASNQPISSSFTEVSSTSVGTTADIAALSPVLIGAVIPFAVGLSAGAIAGIIAGSAVGAAAIGAGTYFAVKKMKENKSKPKPKSKSSVSMEEIKEEPKVEPPPQDDKPEKYKPKGATVNIFELDPNDPQSLTARNPGYKTNN